MPPGSYGIPVCRAVDRATFLLTAAHVVGSLSWAHELSRTDVLLAANSGVPGSGDPIIGHVHLSHPDEPCDVVELDASLVGPVERVALTDVVCDERPSGIPRDVEATVVDDNPVIVYKRGSQQPQLTAGLLDPFATSIVLRTPQSDGTSLARTYPRVFLVYGDGQAFAKPGDSGSAVVDADDCVVGMLVGVRVEDGHAIDENTPGIVVSIIDILETLGLELLGPKRPCTVV
jgi:hypothetical protein